MKFRLPRIIILWAAFAHAGLCLSGAAASADAANGVRPQDEIFLISTRDLYSSPWASIDWQRLRVHRYATIAGEACRRWIPVSIDDFYAEDDPSRVTMVYVHGNWIERGEDTVRGLNAYRALLSRVPGAPPLRVVLFSWPTSRRPGMLRDFRMKAELADTAGLHLAWVLSRMRPDIPVTVVGYSFGARVVTGALHVLAGGSMCRCALPEPVARIPVRVLLIAAAVHHDWLLPGGRHGMAWQLVDRLVLITNRCDPAMRFYHLLERRGRPRALGEFGITRLWALGDASERLVQFDACRAVGKRHGEVYYLSAGPLLRVAGQQILFFPIP